MQTTTDTRIARQLDQGQLTVTGLSKASGQHLTIEFRSRNKGEDGQGRWQRCTFDERLVCFVRERHTGLDVATILANGQIRYKNTSHPRHRALAWLLREVLRQVQGGEAHPDIELSSADQCGRCNRALTDPISIERGIGPECFGKVTGSKYAAQESMVA